MKKILSIIPGFRTNRTWKKIMASLIYTVLLLFMIIIIYVGISGTTDDRTSSWQVMNIIIFFIIIPFLLITNFAGVRNKIPLFKSKKKSMQGLAWLLTTLIVIVSFGIISANITSFYTPEYIAQQQIEKENELKQKAIVKAQQESMKNNAESLTEPNTEEKTNAEISVMTDNNESVEITEQSPEPEPPTAEPAASASAPAASTAAASTAEDDQTTNQNEKRTVKGMVDSAKGFIKSALNRKVDEPFQKERNEFSEENVLKLMENEMVYLQYVPKFWWFETAYYKRTLEYSNYIYFGELKENRPHGKGIIMSASYHSDFFQNVYVPLYIGSFKDGLYSGYGKEFSSASNFYNNYYSGSLFTSIRQDYSSLDQFGLIYPIYEGYFKNGKYHGSGNYMMVDESGLDEPTYLTDYINANESTILEFQRELVNSESPILVSPLPLLNSYVAFSGSFKKRKA